MKAKMHSTDITHLLNHPDVPVKPLLLRDIKAELMENAIIREKFRRFYDLSDFDPQHLAELLTNYPDEFKPYVTDHFDKLTSQEKMELLWPLDTFKTILDNIDELYDKKFYQDYLAQLNKGEYGGLSSCDIKRLEILNSHPIVQKLLGN